MGKELLELHELKTGDAVHIKCINSDKIRSREALKLPLEFEAEVIDINARRVTVKRIGGKAVFLPYTEALMWEITKGIGLEAEKEELERKSRFDVRTLKSGDAIHVKYDGSLCDHVCLFGFTGRESFNAVVMAVTETSVKYIGCLGSLSIDMGHLFIDYCDKGIFEVTLLNKGV